MRDIGSYSVSIIIAPFDYPFLSKIAARYGILRFTIPPGNI